MRGLIRGATLFSWPEKKKSHRDDDGMIVSVLGQSHSTGAV